MKYGLEHSHTAWLMSRVRNLEPTLSTAWHVNTVVTSFILSLRMHFTGKVKKRHDMTSAYASLHLQDFMAVFTGRSGQDDPSC
jgi:hypothetical protein